MEPVLFEALSREKLHQAKQEGATDLLRDFLGQGDFKKFHTSFHTDLACSQVPSCGNWTLSFWAYLLTGQMLPSWWIKFHMGSITSLDGR